MVIDAEYEEIEGNGGELDLPDSDSLPWLESDEEDDEAGGYDTGQIIAFIAILLVLAAGIIGAIYYFANRAGDGAVVADGSVIEAPDGPIKQAPADPQGKEFDGTGNVAPAVGEGQAPDTQIAGPATAGADDPKPSVSTLPAQAEPVPTPTPTQAPKTGGAYVQLAAYGTRARAEKGWSELSRQTEALSGKSYRVVEAVVGGATVYRLQVVASDRASANQLCNAIKADGLDCAVK